MPKPPSKAELSQLYQADEIAQVWQKYQNLEVINHPSEGLISPNKYRAKGKGKPCPYCGKKMVYGKETYSTSSRNEAIKRGYEYTNKRGQKTLNQAGEDFFHPHYVTLDHKINKARCPEKMFDFDNLQFMCWRCNQEKGDNNSFELEHTYDYLEALANEALNRYQIL